MPARKGKNKLLPNSRGNRRGSSTSERRFSNSAQYDEYDEFEGEDMDFAPVFQARVPHDQEKIDEEEKEEVFTRTIKAQNPNASRNLTQFDFEANEYRPAPKIDHMAIHLNRPGILIHVDSEEAQAQKEYAKAQKASQGGGDSDHALGPSALLNRRLSMAGGNEAAMKQLMLKAVAAQTASTSTTEDSKALDELEVYGADDHLKNQFSFSERATQTFNNPMREREVATLPPPTIDTGFTVTQFDIFDTYLEQLQRQYAAKENAEKKKATFGADKQQESSGIQALLNGEEEVKGDTASEEGNVALLKSLKLMERMINQNSEADVFDHYKYYEDRTEHKREDGRGSFWPLWQFIYRKSGEKPKTVTSICWNPQLTDLFAVGYGSYEFGKTGNGLICCYTLKNTSYPEYILETGSGVMSVDFHPQHSELLVAGLYDGSVVVFDVRNKSGKPLYVSTDPKTKHTDPVWQVAWNPADTNENASLSFYSVSSDGRVTNWVMNKNELVNEEVVELKLEPKTDSDGEEDADDTNMIGLAGGSCFDFNKFEPGLFVVGTEEGSIHAYSSAANSNSHIKTYEGHNMAVYTVRWNPFHPDIFLSCGADWTVKLWEADHSQPIMTFDLNCAVADVAWAPYSSTVFAVVTTDRRLRVYDLNIDKHAPIGKTRARSWTGAVASKASLTHIAFNPVEPIICIGDDKGVVNILKLSGNLRVMSAEQIADVNQAEEVAKLDALLIIDEHDEPDFLKQRVRKTKTDSFEEEVKVAEVKDSEN